MPYINYLDFLCKAMNICLHMCNSKGEMTMDSRGSAIPSSGEFSVGSMNVAGCGPHYD